MNRRAFLSVSVAAAMLIAPTAALAKPGGGHGGGGGGGGSTGPYSLRFYNCALQYTGDGNGVTVDGFTRGTSVDGGRQAVTLDGANCFNSTVSPTSVFAIGFRDFWEMGLDQVTALKASFSTPLTQGGSPRITVELYDGTTYVGDNNLFLSPSTCGSPNGNGWITSDFRNAVACSFTDSAGRTYSGTAAYTDESLVYHPAVSAWDDMLASGEHTGDKIWYSYAIADQSTVNRIDRITLNGQVFTN